MKEFHANEISVVTTVETDTLANDTTVQMEPEINSYAEDGMGTGMFEKLNEQGRDGQYSFGYRVQDEIKDNYMERQEERKDGVVRGHYAYSDGYFHRSVTYIADENGFRVTEMKVRIFDIDILHYGDLFRKNP